MARKIKGLYWEPATGKGKVDKVVGGRRVQQRFAAGSWQEAESTYYRLIAAEPKHVEQQRTFRAAATKYLKEATHKSLGRDAQALAKIDPWIGSLEIGAVHQGTLQPYIDHARAAGNSSGTIQRDLATVRRILTLAARLWRDANNQPWLSAPPIISAPKGNDQKKPYPLTHDEERKLLLQLPVHLAEMALFGLNTGARSSVICALKWEWEVKVPELGTFVFIVPEKHTKNGTEQLIVLNGVARSIVESKRSSGGHVFGYNGLPITRMHNKGWTRAWARAGLPLDGTTLSGPHNLRHTFAIRLRAAGVRLETIRALMHHRDGNVTTHYSRAQLPELIEAVELLVESKPKTLLRRVV